MVVEKPPNGQNDEHEDLVGDGHVRPPTAATNPKVEPNQDDERDDANRKACDLEVELGRKKCGAKKEEGDEHACVATHEQKGKSGIGEAAMGRGGAVEGGLFGKRRLGVHRKAER